MLRPTVLDSAALVLGALALLGVAGPRIPGAPGLVPAALVSVPLVLADVRGRRLPDLLTLPLLAAAVALVPTGGTVLAAVATLLCLGALHLVGGLGLGDVKLGTALAAVLAPLGPAEVLAGPALAFVLAGLWVLVLRGRGRIAFGPFQLAAFWLLV